MYIPLIYVPIFRDLDTRYFYIKAFGDEDYIAVEDIQFEEEVGQDRDQGPDL